MSRKPRSWFPGARFHITARGNRGTDLFYDDLDFKAYLDFIQLCKEETPFILHAYCLMTNHVHLLIEVLQHPPGDIMKFIQFRYAKHFNKRHKLHGHVFQGRYYSKMIQTRPYFLAASKYIHLNPVTARMCLLPDRYVWSSYRQYLSEGEGSIVYTKALLDCFEEPKRKRYEAYIIEKGGVAFDNYCEEYRPQGS
ncbi:transposase [Halobacillus yeomjeoni]|uniref:transposase n=1 Tax=Halobacillus yeomjeoni TaxID=311194 RepID=UPI001CD57AEB|nr:transposase [Halobacillus yeomjeoni]MCA0985174.1 transposase [Halobacillus yeomjeoni]